MFTVEFNIYRNNQWKKRGISVIPTTFGAGFFPKVLSTVSNI